MKLLIKKIKRVGHGFRNFDNYRLRLLLHCGVNWQTPNRHHSEAGYHAWLRRARYPSRPGGRAIAPYLAVDPGRQNARRLLCQRVARR